MASGHVLIAQAKNRVEHIRPLAKGMAQTVVASHVSSKVNCYMRDVAQGSSFSKNPRTLELVPSKDMLVEENRSNRAVGVGAGAGGKGEGSTPRPVDHGSREAESGLFSHLMAVRKVGQSRSLSISSAIFILGMT